MKPTRRQFCYPRVPEFRAGTMAIAAFLLAMPSLAADWPTWRYDAARTGSSPEPLAEELRLQWVRQFPPLRPAYWQVRQERVQFDLGYEPVVLGETMYLGSSRNDRITALDTETGREKWRFYTEGPVRLAPTAWEGKVYCASDDGFLYCLNAETGALLWKHRAAPSRRRIIGNGRLISVWPVRGGPVVAGGRVFFAAGVWPFEGIFVWALDAETGKPIWVNDRCGALYVEHPHNAMAFGGPSPQGYLLVRGNELIVPSGRAFPAYFDLETGKLLHFDFGYAGHGSRPGSWFVVADSEGEMLVDPELNAKIHDAGLQVIGQPGVRPQPDDVHAETITIGRETYRLQAGVRGVVSAGGQELRFADGFPGVDGEVHTMLAAGGRLFVVSREGTIYCFGTEQANAITHPLETRRLDRPDDGWAEKARRMIDRAGARAGYAVVVGLGTGRLAEELAGQSDLNVIVLESDAERAAAFCRRLDDAGLYGERIVVHVEGPEDLSLPTYFASLIVAEDPEAVGVEAGGPLLEALFNALRPYGGAICLALPADAYDRLAERFREAGLHGADVRREGDLSLLVRAGPLAGAADYRGGRNYDERLRSPLGLLWFGDTFHRHKLFYRGFQHETGRGLPQGIDVVDGLMRYEVTEEPYGPNPRGIPYQTYLRLLDDQMVYFDGFTDVYTGRVLPEAEVRRMAVEFNRAGEAAGEATAESVLPEATVRRNPLTGLMEAREMVKTYGCDRYTVDYGELATYRSGTRRPITTIGWRAARSASAGSARAAATVPCRPAAC